MSPISAPSPLAYFSAHHIFGMLTPDELARIASEVVVRRYPKGHRLCYAGDPVTSVFVVTSGLVALMDDGGGGDVHAMLTFLPGDAFGAAAAALNLPHSGSATAVVDTHTLVMRAESFAQLYWSNPKVAHETLRELHRIETRAQQTILRLATKQVASRIGAFLLQMAAKPDESAGQAPAFDLALSHEDLAVLVGTTRVTVTRVMARLARAKLIVATGRRVVILRPDILRQLVERS